MGLIWFEVVNVPHEFVPAPGAANVFVPIAGSAHVSGSGRNERLFAFATYARQEAVRIPGRALLAAVQGLLALLGSVV